MMLTNIFIICIREHFNSSFSDISAFSKLPGILPELYISPFLENVSEALDFVLYSPIQADHIAELRIFRHLSLQPNAFITPSQILGKFNPEAPLPHPAKLRISHHMISVQSPCSSFPHFGSHCQSQRYHRSTLLTNMKKQLMLTEHLEDINSVLSNFSFYLLNKQHWEMGMTTICTSGNGD